MVRIVHSLSLYGGLRATATWRATPALRGTIDPGRVNHSGQAKGRVQTNLDPLGHNTFLGNRPPTPPLKPTLTLTSHLGQNVGLGKG